MTSWQELVFQNNEMAAMLVSNPVQVELLSDVNTFLFATLQCLIQE